MSFRAESIRNNADTAEIFSVKARAGLLPYYADDAAFITAKGSSAAAGDAYINTTVKAIRRYSTSWETLATTKHVEALNIVTENVIPDLTYTPVEVNQIDLIVGGLLQAPTFDFSLSNKTLTWLSGSTITLQPGSVVYARYPRAD